jgi:hypothetical protein
MTISEAHRLYLWSAVLLAVLVVVNAWSWPDPFRRFTWCLEALPQPDNFPFAIIRLFSILVNIPIEPLRGTSKAASMKAGKTRAVSGAFAGHCRTRGGHLP